MSADTKTAPMTGASSIRLRHEVLRLLATEIFRRAGVEGANAGVMANSLIDTSLRGVDSHGIMRIPMYIESLRAGTVDGRAPMSYVVESGAIAVLDALNGLGSVATTRAMERAIELSQEYGIGCVGVRNSTHFGASGHYALMAARRDCVGLVWTNGPAVMPPPGGREARVSNDPLAIALPSGGEPVLLDISFSVVARGKVRKALAEGWTTIPDDWMLTEDGRPTTDPKEAITGLGRPIAGHKGYGMAFMAELLCGAMMGSGIGRGVRSEWAQNSTPGTTGAPPDDLFPLDPTFLGVGHLCLTWNIAAFTDLETFKRRVDTYVADIHACPTVPGESAPQVPGEPERRAWADRTTNGIPVSQTEYDGILSCAAGLGVPVPEDLVADHATEEGETNAG